MKRLIILAPTMALLFGCSGGGAGNGAGAVAVSLQPGMWETTMQFTTIDMPGAPPEAIGPMRALMGQPQTRSFCMTAEQAANPTGQLTNTEGGGANGCQFERNTYAGGTINVSGTCTHPTRGTLQMTLTGSYTPTTIETQIDQRMQAPANTPGPQSIHVAGRVTSRRTGDCPPGAPTAPGAPAAPAGGNTGG
jgi:hypothetical protein